VGKPNILFLFADQMHGFAMGCMGHPDVKTPNLDGLAARGTLFTDAYSSAPVCTPFRGMLLSGRYGCQTGMLGNNQALPEGEATLAEGFNRAGYHSSYVGKWHIGATGNQAIPKELRCGFTDFLGYQCYNSFTSGIEFFDEAHEKRVFSGHRTTVTTDLAIERFDKAMKDGKGKPVALVVSYQNPHYPLQPLPEYEAMYLHGTLTKRGNHKPETEPWTQTHSPPSHDKTKDAEYQKYGGNMDLYLRLYYAMVTQLDAQIGRILAHLKKVGQAENTIVVFTSDHGDMQGSHGKTNKAQFYEESTRIPLIVYDPRGKGGSVIKTPVGCVDFYPTLLDWAGLDAQAEHWKRCEGKSLAPWVLAGEAKEARPVMIEEISHYGVALREGDWKLVMHRHTREVTNLYDLGNDPFEMKNLAGEAEAKEMQERMHQRVMGMFDDVKSRMNPAAKLPKYALGVV
jgi:arylsulfatase A-like enzyme